jgi:hypothetical protein
LLVFLLVNKYKKQLIFANKEDTSLNTLNYCTAGMHLLIHIKHRNTSRVVCYRWVCHVDQVSCPCDCFLSVSHLRSMANSFSNSR